MFYTTVYDEGVFGLISNLGSLVVRIIFQPFEEAAFTTFSRSVLHRCQSLLYHTGANRTGVSQSASDMAKMRDMLSVMIRGICIVGFLPVVFGPPSSSLFLRLLYSQRWSETEAPVVLAYYCPYIALMALNGLFLPSLKDLTHVVAAGICEAFVHAVLDVKDLKVSNVFMMISAGFHVVVSITFIRYAGAVGLVLADSLNMLGRIIFALWSSRRKPSLCSASSVGAFVVISDPKETSASERCSLMDQRFFQVSSFRQLCLSASSLWKTFRDSKRRSLYMPASAAPFYSYSVGYYGRRNKVFGTNCLHSDEIKGMIRKIVSSSNLRVCHGGLNVYGSNNHEDYLLRRDETIVNPSLSVSDALFRAGSR